MAMTIGVCDDNPQQVGLLVQYLNRHPRAAEFDIIQSTDPDDFLKLVQNKMPQLVFLDIDMGAANGISLGEQIKALSKDAVIVYVTAHEKYALDAFGVRAFHYLLKPLTREKFEEVLEEALKYIDTAPVKSDKTLTIKTKKQIICLDYSDIVFFEKTGHKIKIHTAERDFYYYDNFANLLATLGSNAFIQCHQGFIANISMITGFCDKTLFLGENIALPVSRSYIDTVKKMLTQRLFGGEDGP